MASLFRSFILRSEQTFLAAPPQVELVEDEQMQLGRDPAEQSHRYAHGDFVRGLAVIDQSQDAPRKSGQHAERHNCDYRQSRVAPGQSPKTVIGPPKTDRDDGGVPVFPTKPAEQPDEDEP